jgi:DNA-directed RNA polymerase specialized sigma24 family protein
MTQTVPSVFARPRVPAARRGGGPQQNGMLAELLLRCADHDPTALAQLYELTSEWIYAVLRRRTASVATAEEAMVEVYTRVWRRAATFPALERTALAWMTSIAFETIS